MKNKIMNVLKSIFAPSYSEYMVVNGVYYRLLACKKYELSKPSISEREYQDICNHFFS